MVYHFLKYALFPMSESNIVVNHQLSVPIRDYTLYDNREVGNWIPNREAHNDVSEDIELTGICPMFSCEESVPIVFDS